MSDEPDSENMIWAVLILLAWAAFFIGLGLLLAGPDRTSSEGAGKPALEQTE